MIELRDAYETILNNTLHLPSETIGLSKVRGRVLAQDVVSDMDMPPFDKSAMDGYACRKRDLPGPLRVLGFVGAGQQPEVAVTPGGCVKIMTGAAVPPGADVVIPVEDVKELPQEQNIRGPVSQRPSNIVPRAEDVRDGQVVLTRGTRIRAQEIAVLCAVGCTKVSVSRLPVVAVLATGDELVEPDRRPGPAGIRNSNSHQLIAQLSALGINPRYLGIAEDTTESLDRAIGQAADCDLLLVSGGVSAGDLDLVPAALRRSGFDLLFDKVAVKPGKPTVFGRSDKALCFGLPGNPVASFVIFELLVAPVLQTMMGATPGSVLMSARMNGEFRRRRSGREEWVPVSFSSPETVRLVEYHGSGHIHALTQAEGLMRVPAHVAEVADGMAVTIRLLV